MTEDDHLRHLTTEELRDSWRETQKQYRRALCRALAWEHGARRVDDLLSSRIPCYLIGLHNPLRGRVRNASGLCLQLQLEIARREGGDDEAGPGGCH